MNKKLKILLVAWFDPNGINTVLEHVNSIKNLSKHKVDIYNTYGMPWNRHGKKINFPKLTLNYDCIILHNATTYTIDFVRQLSNCFWPSLENFKGIKVIMKQDEMRRVQSTRNIIDDWGIDLITTCVPSDEIEKVYELSKRPNLKVLHTHTGYVTEGMKNFKIKSLSQRSYDVSYRGMPTPFEWGRLGYEKYEIAHSFPACAEKYKLNCNISAKTEDRLNGDAWIQLLADSRAALAVESGASIFDFDGSVEAYCENVRKSRPLATFEEVHSEFLHKYEGNVKYNQISPRHIEAAYTGAVQILYEGEYSNLLKPEIGRAHV